MNFVAVGLFYIEHTNKLYYMSIAFTNDATRLPDDTIEDIKILVNEINSSSSHLPFGAVCVDIDAVIDTRGNVIWVHDGEVTYNDNIELMDIEEIKKYEKDRK